MRRKPWLTVAYLAVLVALMGACVGRPARPPHFGFFLRAGSKLLEMQEFTGPPDRGETEGIPATANAQPVVIAWHDGIILEWLQLFSDYGDGDLLPFDVTPQADGVLELRPQDVLTPDVYCFVQGHPLGTPYQLPTWCFRVAEGAAAGSQSSGKEAGFSPWLLLAAVAAAVAVVLLVLFSLGRRRAAAPRGAHVAASRAAPAFCMHCGQPVQPGSRFCMHCGKPLS